MTAACGLGFQVFPSATALRTQADYSEQVLAHFELVFRRHRILDCFELRGKEFNDLATFGTDHVIVMLMFVVVFVVCAAVPKPNFPRKSRFSQYLQSSIDGCLSNCGVFLLHQAIEVFAGKMFFRSQKYIQNKVPLRGTLKSFLLKVFQKYLLLFGHIRKIPNTGHPDSDLIIAGLR